MCDISFFQSWRLHCMTLCTTWRRDRRIKCVEWRSWKPTSLRNFLKVANDVCSNAIADPGCLFHRRKDCVQRRAHKHEDIRWSGKKQLVWFILIMRQSNQSSVSGSSRRHICFGHSLEISTFVGGTLFAKFKKKLFWCFVAHGCVARLSDRARCRSVSRG